LQIAKYNRNNKFWQANYYDHIIRNEKSYAKIAEYILTNPSKWADDILNPDYVERNKHGKI
ncbi:MAG: hypothetical protein JXR56_05035, partial [Candidatus Cloacimonetes bacterium]|nr:hypothetical protein [Candidatus Cloacimonadota bacterium]